MRKLGSVLETGVLLRMLLGTGVLVRKVKRKNILLGMMLDSWGAAGMGAQETVEYMKGW